MDKAGQQSKDEKKGKKIEPEQAPSALRPQRIKLKRWKAVALWSWNLEVDTCAICRNQLTDLCIDCQASESSAPCDCPVAWGGCDHAFHYHCIRRWLKKKGECPICEQMWEFKENSAA